MTKGIIGGMTDYNNQSFIDIIDDLKIEKENIANIRKKILDNIEVLKSKSYWNNNVHIDFQNIINYSLQHFKTTTYELTDIIKDLKIEVKEHHIKRLYNISKIAQSINVDIGVIWHQKYLNKDYNNQDFRLVEKIYGDTRDYAVSLLDISNIADRLNDFIGKKDILVKKNNPWISGSFYFAVSITIITILGTLSNFVHWSLLPIIIIGAILLILIIGILQLKNDDKISDKSFVSLVVETFKKLPLIKNKPQ